MITLFPLLKGFATGGSLIVAIGAQNAFVIKQGLRRQHLLLTALLCSLVDSILITLGVIGFGHFLASYPAIIDIAKYFACVFLFIYGAISFKAALTPSSLDTNSNTEQYATVKKTVLLLLAFSLLNPHVYLDTVILLGSIASQYPFEEQVFFAFGAIIASFAWFFMITYGARLLAPLFQKEISWRIIDVIVGVIMWSIALTLLITK